MPLTDILSILLSERRENYAESCQISPYVWQLRHKTTDELHYLKLAKSKIQRKLLANEVHWLNHLSGGYLPGVIDFSDETECSLTWLLTRKAPGQALNQLIRANQIGEADYNRIIIGLFSALAHSHRQGVVHSDIKPTNLIWCPQQQQLSLIDWGSACPSGCLISEQPWRSFSPSYSPPALQRGEGHISPLADWYSFLIIDQLLRQQPLPIFNWQQTNEISCYYLDKGYCPTLSGEQKLFLHSCMTQMELLG